MAIRIFFIKLQTFFDNELTEIFLLFLITIYILLGFITENVHEQSLKALENLLLVIFWLEIAGRFLAAPRKSVFFKSFSLDIIAILPWDLIIGFFLPQGIGAFPNLVLLLRLPRFLRFLRLFRGGLLGRIIYVVKKNLGKGLREQILTLAGLIVFFILSMGIVFSFLQYRLNGHDPFWTVGMFLIDQGTLTGYKAEGVFWHQVLLLFLTIVGILVMNGVVVGIMVSAFISYMRRVGSGHVDIHETNHILLIGWDDIVSLVLDELDAYCVTEEKPLIVVHLHTWDESRFPIPKYRFKRLEYIAKKGNSLNPESLNSVSLESARAVILLGDDTLDILDQDRRIVQQYMTLTVILAGLKVRHGVSIHYILANLNALQTVRDFQNYALSDKIPTTIHIDKHYYISSLLESMLIQRNFFSMMLEILSFEGQDFHLLPEGSFEGKDFLELVAGFNKTLPVGVISQNGISFLPDAGYKIKPTDRIVTLSENEKTANCETLLTYHASPANLLLELPRYQSRRHAIFEKTIAIIGLNDSVAYLLQDFARWNLTVYIFSRAREEVLSGLLSPLREQKLLQLHCFSVNDITDDILCKHLPPDASKIILLPDEAGMPQASPQEVDLETISRLIAVRKAKALGKTTWEDPIVEMLTPSQEELVRNLAGNYVIGPLILSKFLTVTTLYPSIGPFIQSLVNRGGMEIDSMLLSSFFAGDRVGFRELAIGMLKSFRAIPIGVIRKAGTGKHEFLVNPLSYSGKKGAPEFQVEADDEVVFLIQT